MNIIKTSEHLLDPETRDIAIMMSPADTQSTSEMYYLEQRKLYGPSSFGDVRKHYDVEVEEIFVDSLFDDNKIRIVLIKPKNKSIEKHPLIFSVHGGGMFMGSPEMDSEMHAYLAQHYNFIGVSADYRLAPEFSQPSQLYDLYSSIKWCIDNNEELNLDINRVAIGGGSAGAGLAAGLALYIRDHKEFTFHHLRLMLPMLDDRTTTKEHPYNGQYVWTNDVNYFGWKSVLNQEPGFDEILEYYSPARATSLAGFPSTYLSVGSIELFADETLNFAKQLMYDGVLTELHVYPGFHHCSTLVPSAFLAKCEAKNSINALLRALNIPINDGLEPPSIISLGLDKSN